MTVTTDGSLTSPAGLILIKSDKPNVSCVVEDTVPMSNPLGELPPIPLV